MDSIRSFFILFSTLLTLPISAVEYDAIVNGIYYKLDKQLKEAMVVMGSEQSGMFGVEKIDRYQGDIVIPETIAYEDDLFYVTSIEGFSGWRKDILSWGAFSASKELTSITLPSSIKKIGLGAFDGCIGLKAVYISDLPAWCNIEYPLNDIFGESKVQTNPLYYAHDLYLNGSLISELVIPENVSIVKQRTFVGGSFTSVKFHKNFKAIEQYAFVGCESLKDVFSYSPYINAEFDSFSDTQAKTLHVRERYKDAYVILDSDNLYYWLDFGKMEFIEGVDFKLIYIVDEDVYKSEIKEVGEPIIPEAEPTKEGYEFSGWSDIPKVMPNHDVIIKGIYSPKIYKLTYVVDGEVYKVYEVYFGETINAEDYPTRKGMSFSGWGGIPPKMPANDVVVTGSFSWSTLLKDNVIYQVTDTINNYCSAIGNENASGDVIIAAAVDLDCCYSVVTIADKAFYGKKAITTIDIPQTITTIEERAFANIDKLTDITCWAEDVPTTDRTAFENSYIEDYVTLHVPYRFMEKYKEVAPWKTFKSVVAIEGTESKPQEKCSEPTIEYIDGKLIVNSDTKGAECVTRIMGDDFGEHQGNEIEVTATYTISAYAKADDYDNSNTVTATLCWIEEEGTSTKINDNIRSRTALIQNYDGMICVRSKSLQGTIEVFNVEGQLVGSEIIVNGTANVRTNLKLGDIALVKIGKKTIKILLR